MRIEYFAWLHDKVGVEREEVTIPPEVTDVQSLMHWLSGRGPNYADAFEFAEVVKVVVNRENAHYDDPVKQEDEVIFIPPISGG